VPSTRAGSQPGAGGAAIAARTLGRRRAMWIAIVGLCMVAGGGALIAGHARHLAAATVSTPQAVNSVRAAYAYQSVLPGAAFTVPAQAGLSTSIHPGGALLVASGMQAAPAVRVDLCSQMRSPSDARLLPLRLGYRFDDVKRWVQRNEESDARISLRNVLLVADNGADAVPEIQIEGTARADFADPLSEPLQLGWRNAQSGARWISDASFGQIEQGASGQVALRQQGWLLWGAASALRIERRANAMCPQAGELVVQMYRLAPPAAAAAGTPAGALVVAFPARGRAVSTTLAAGSYQVPAAAPAALEDQSLFNELQEQGLVRLTSAGAIELAPRDLPQWQAAGAAERAAELDNWKQVKPGAATHKLFKRLYYQADGAYVRQQIDIYNSERRLLAWRVKAPAGLALDWSASAGSDASSGSVPSMVATTSQMPVAASRLFASLPQGWQPWMRVARWPQAAEGQGARPVVRLSLALPRAAQGGEVMQVLVAGRVTGTVGASAQSAPACTGRACASGSDVQQLTLTLQAGTHSVQLTAQPLDFNAPEDQKYRHLRVAAGRLVWQVLSPAAGDAAPGVPRPA
ncbi:hypothetical protein GTP91_33000, partial [Rugamonas sp. FT82W]|nr:hypothetical protein [Duganella vulcania]